MSLLNAGQQAAFQQGSFDVYAHPASGGGTFYESGGDIVATNPLANPDYVNYSLVTSNNVGVSVGIGTQVDPVGDEGGPSPQLVEFTSDPHTVTYQNPSGPSWETSTEQSPGYGVVIWTTETLNTLQYVGKVSGINDHGSLALTEYTYPGPSFSLVTTPHLYGPNGDVSLGSLGGTNGVANSLNNSNEVVGWSQIASGAQHAFLYINGSMEDLNLLIPSSSGITLTSAVGIDAAGDIVAYGTNAAGQTNEYYLTPAEVPAPEPGTLAIATLLITAAAARVVQKRARRLDTPRNSDELR